MQLSAILRAASFCFSCEIKFYMNKSLFGIPTIYFFLSFSKNAMVSLLKPWPFQVEVLVTRIQHWPSGYFNIRADVPASEPVRIQGRVSLLGV